MSEHIPGSGDSRRLSQQLRGPVFALAVMTGLSMLSLPVLGPLGWLLVIGCVCGWLVLGVYVIVHRSVINPVGDAIGRVLVPTGSSTPSVNQHSDIETLAVRGKFAEAAAAYQAVIASDPTDLVACEKLGQLAMRDLKDYQLAVTAYREAEKRAASEKSKVAFGVIVAELYRDKLGEPKRAVVELGRLLARYPDAPNAAALREELDLIKAHLFEGQGG